MIMYTDGACLGNPGPGGWGTILWADNNEVEELGGFDPDTTNNRMEIQALISGLRHIAADPPQQLLVRSDSRYVLKGANEWLGSWKRRNWPPQILNLDLWRELDQLLGSKDYTILWEYVPGHSGIPGNERADAIASAFAKNQPLTLYDGSYESYGIDLANVNKDKKLPHKGRKGKPLYYLSLVNGQLCRHQSWEDCSRRVSGVRGARFKKILSPEDAEQTLASWGLS